MKLRMLSSPIRIGGKVAPNRIVNQPVECNDGDPSGSPTERTLERYRNLAQGGAGIIFIEALAVTPEGRARKNQLLITEDTARDLEGLVRGMREMNGESLILFQLHHSGSLSDAAFSRAVSAYPTKDPGVHTLTDEELEEISSRYVSAAVLSKQVGADGIDFKHCHGYLTGELIRPANVRKGRFGGSFENRTRFFTETVQRMKAALGDGPFVVGVRYSVYEGIPGGFGTAGPKEVMEDLSEPLAFARMIERMGLDYVSVSAGTSGTTGEIIRPGKAYPEGVYRHFGWAKAVKDVVDIPVIGAGYSYLGDGKNDLKEPDPGKKSLLYWAERNLENGHVDMVGVGRQSMADPLFARKVLSGDVRSVHFCTARGGCSRLLQLQRPVGCTVHQPFYAELLRRAQEEGR